MLTLPPDHVTGLRGPQATLFIGPPKKLWTALGPHAPEPPVGADWWGDQQRTADCTLSRAASPGWVMSTLSRAILQLYYIYTTSILLLPHTYIYIYISHQYLQGTQLIQCVLVFCSAVSLLRMPTNYLLYHLNTLLVLLYTLFKYCLVIGGRGCNHGGVRERSPVVTSHPAALNWQVT